MIYAEFEEKEFEGPLYTQLLQGSNLLWPPGQVLEKTIGVDATMFTSHHFFWRLFGFSHPLQGALLPHYLWGFIRKHRNKDRKLPNFKLNLFIQSKRPEFYISTSRKYQAKGINGSYWRFDVTKHQQRALEKVASKLKDCALVVYAAPVFHKVDDLYIHIRNNTIVQNSTFPPVIKLRAHKSWIYQEPGIKGWAFSKPEFIEEPPLFDQITSMFIKEEPSEGEELRGVKQNLQTLISIIHKALTEEKQLNPRIKEYFYLLKEIKMKTPHFKEENVLIENFLAVSLFCAMFNLNWYVIGE
jgi:hypothetical protein